MSDSAVQRSTITVFGGTGFLGRRVVRASLKHGFRIRVASRHPGRGDSRGAVEPVEADVHNEDSVARAVDGAYGVVNAVSLYVERGGQTFHAVHVVAAERVARLARQAGVRRLVHLSGIGSDPRSDSPYIRSRGEGEFAVRHAFPETVLLRPAVMIGPDDAFLTPLRRLLGTLPLFALFGRGRTRLQPAHVEDVAEAIARILASTDSASVYELAGPRIYRYTDLLRTVARHDGRAPLFLPVPFGLWHCGAAIAELLPKPPITRNQVDLMRVDNIRSPDRPGFEALGITPRPLEDALRGPDDADRMRREAGTKPRFPRA